MTTCAQCGRWKRRPPTPPRYDENGKRIWVGTRRHTRDLMRTDIGNCGKGTQAAKDGACAGFVMRSWLLK